MTLEDQVDRMVQDLAAEGEAEAERFRDAIQTDLEQEQARGAQARERHAIVTELLNAVIEVPVDALEEEMRSVAWSMAKRAHEMGFDFSEALRGVDAVAEVCKKQARERCKLRVVMHKLALKWKLETDESEIRAEVNRIASAIAVEPKVMLRHLAESGGLQGIQEQIVTAKVWARLEAGDR